jgi:hypothetical protein
VEWSGGKAAGMGKEDVKRIVWYRMRSEKAIHSYVERINHLMILIYLLSISEIYVFESSIIHVGRAI